MAVAGFALNGLLSQINKFFTAEAQRRRGYAEKTKRIRHKSWEEFGTIAGQSMNLVSRYILFSPYLFATSCLASLCVSSAPLRLCGEEPKPQCS
jgi:hypothetical protein